MHNNISLAVIIISLGFKFKMQIGDQMNPIPLIQFDQNRFYITEEAKKFLSELDQPLGVVTIVGKYRTGKSLFLNKVLLNNRPESQSTQLKKQQFITENNKNCNFKVCPTINSCTKGLWISKQTIISQHPQCQGMKVLVIDSEGFGAMEESESYCNNILLLALLLSSYFIYNSVGSIDEKSLNNLNIITNLAKQLQSKNMNSQKLEEQFPAFMWVVRDFTLKLVDSNGFQIESKQYLEEALEIKKGVSDAVQGKNKIRRMIKHFFKQRDCCTLVTPVIGEDKLQKLNTLSDQQFRPQFLEQISTLRQKIMRKIKVKKLKNRKMTGPTLLELAETYSAAINSGSLPNLDSTWKHIANFQTKRSFGKIKNEVSQKVSKFGKKIHNQTEISDFHKLLLEQTLERCKHLFFIEPEITQNYEKIKEQIQTLVQDVRQMNNKTSMDTLINIFNEKTMEMQQNLQLSSPEEFYREICQLQSFFKKEFKENPSLPGFFSLHFYPLYLQKFLYLSKCYEKSLKKSEQNFNKLSKENEQTIQKVTENLKKCQNEFQQSKQHTSMTTIKLSQQIKIKQLQITYLNKQIDQSKEDIEVLLQKINKLEQISSESKKQNQKLMNTIYSIELNLNQSKHSNKFTDKQLTILKNTLTNKNQQINQLKHNIVQLQCQLDKVCERQKTLTNRTKSQIQNKSTEYQMLMNKFDLAGKQMNVLSQKLVKAQTKVEEHYKHHTLQKRLYEEMLQNMKGTLEVQMRNRDELIETNKNMGFALKHLEERFQHIQEKQKKLKQFKRCIKNSSCLQCVNCSKFYVPSIFSQHLNICIIGPESLKDTQKQRTTKQEPIQIKVIQTLLKDSDSKPYTQYVLQLKKSEHVWKITRKYKSFCDLHSLLKTQFPGVILSENSFIVNPQQGTKKSLLVEQRRKILEKYLNDLSKNPIIAHSHHWREFIQDFSEPQLINIQSPSKSALSQMIRSNNLSEIGSPDKQNISFFNKGHYKTPEEFLKIWNQRNIRVKEVSKNRKIK